MELISPNKETCVKCRACMEICPMRVIEQDEEGYPKPIHDAFKICINCGYCVDGSDAPGAEALGESRRGPAALETD